MHDLLVNLHNLSGIKDDILDEADVTAEIESKTISDNNNNNGSDDKLLVQTVNSSSNGPNKPTISPADIRKVLSTKNTRFLAKVHNITYKVVAYDSSCTVSFVDRGANGGIAGNDIRVIEKTKRYVDVQGIDNHQMNHILIVTAGGVTKTQRGEVILILNQYAYVGRGTSIHSSPQIEAYKNKVDDRAIKAGGKQVIQTIDG